MELDLDQEPPVDLPKPIIPEDFKILPDSLEKEYLASARVR